MKEKHECRKCAKEFDSENALTRHDKTKHLSEVVGRKFHLKTFLSYALISLVLGGVGYWALQSITNPTNPNLDSTTLTTKSEGAVISNQPVHWHPSLKITIKGSPQMIPENTGIGLQYAGNPLYESSMGMTGLHTHDASGTLHWEIPRPPRESDLRLGNFFSIWKKTFSKNCIFEFCNSAEGTVKMSVNGKPNAEFENYLVMDKDTIEIRYE